MIKNAWLFWDTAHLCQEIKETSLYDTWHCPGKILNIKVIFMALDIINPAVVEYDDGDDDDDDYLTLLLLLLLLLMNNE